MERNCIPKNLRLASGVTRKGAKEDERKRGMRRDAGMAAEGTFPFQFARDKTSSLFFHVTHMPFIFSYLKDHPCFGIG